MTGLTGLTGRGKVVVLWDPEVSPPPGPLLDAAALATPGWDWFYIGAPTPIRVPTMMTDLGIPDDVDRAVGRANVVVGAPTLWTLTHVVASGTRFVAVTLGPAAAGDVDAAEVTVEGWPTPEQWPGVIDAATTLDEDHQQKINGTPAAEQVADGVRQLLAEIQARYLPAALRPPQRSESPPMG